MQTIRKIASGVYKGWMAFARALAFINTRIILTLFFVLIIGPIALVLRLAGKDFLQRTIDSSPSFWKDREHAEHSLENASRQF